MTQPAREEWLERHRSLGEFERVGYLGLGEAYNRALYSLRRRHFLALLRRLRFDATARILDVGSGTGFYVDLYQRLGATDVHGIDLSPDAVRDLSERYPAYEFAVGDVADGVPAPLDRHAPFDLVSAMDVLFHVTDDRQWARALANCGDVVRRGGILLVSDNFPRAPLPATASQSFHTLHEHAAILGALGFHLVELSPVFFVSNGQVSTTVRGKAMGLYWRTVVRVLEGSLRASRPLGESIGGITGSILTTLDAALGRQRHVKGYSTKVAVFRRQS